jgi:hypothetical protein
MNGYILAALIGLFVSGLAYVQGRADGGKLERAEYTAKRLQEATEYGIAVNGLQTRYKAQERHWAQSFSQVSTFYQAELKKGDKALATALAAGRLRDPYAKACEGSAPGAATNTGAPNQGGAELSTEFDRFLKSEAARADKIVVKLNYCIGLLEKER